MSVPSAGDPSCAGPALVPGAGPDPQPGQAVPPRAIRTVGSISTTVLFQLLLGGVPGVILGCILSTRVPAQKLKTVVATVAICAGLQLMWSGAHAYAASHAVNAVHVVRTVAASATR